MVSIFEFDDYRAFLATYIEKQGAAGYGIKGRWAKSLGISSSLMSQIFKGQKSLTGEQASDLCDVLGLNELESDYLHALVDIDRSGHHRYRGKLEKKLKKIKKDSQKIGNRVNRKMELTEEQKAIFFSSWLYAGSANLVALNEMNTGEQIADRLNVPLATVQLVIRFLLDNGVLKKEKNQLTNGTSSIHIDRHSPFVNQHHFNWRQQALNIMEHRRESDLFFTCPMSLSSEHYQKISEMIPNFIQEIMEIIGPSESEEVGCLNIDLFRY